MQKGHQALWDRCLQLIKHNVTEQTYKTWFEPIVFEHFDEKDQTVLVQVPSQYVYEYLEQHYVRLMAWALNNSFGANVKLAYRLVVDRENGKTVDVEGNRPTGLDAPGPASRGNLSPTALDAAVPQDLCPQLNPEKTFYNFIEGASNKLPRTVGLSIAARPGKLSFNPFFVFGPSGCGKTHLINAVGVECKRLFPRLRVLYVSARLFQVQFTDAVRRNSTNDFISFYQTIDVLIVDDIQEWATSPKTLDTFFHIFDHLFRLGRQIVLASDRPPVDLEGVKERLLTRFSCGLTAELEKPDPQLCSDILLSVCRRNGLKIPADVISYIAQTANGSVRDLEGVVNSLMAYSIVYNSAVDLRLAERIVRRSVKAGNRPITVDDILEKVCRHYGVPQQQVSGRSRKRELVQARQVSMYLAQKYTGMPASRIGRLIGGRDHSTVLHSCAAVEQRMKADKAFMEEMNTIEGRIANPTERETVPS